MFVVEHVYECLIDASTANQVPPEIVTSIISVEGGRHGASNLNKNQTQDLGIMQINTGVWLPLISHTFFLSDDSAAYNALKYDDCFNVQVGVWILSYSIYLEGGRIWDGVGRYHSGTQSLKEDYTQKVKEKYMKLFHDGEYE